MTGQQCIEIVVEQTSAEPVRLDVYLAAKLPGLSRSRIRKLIEGGLVVTAGKPAKAGLRLRNGDRLEITIPPPAELDVKAQDIPLAVIYEDEYLVVVNKPAGLVTHPGAGVSEGTLVNALLHHCSGTLSGISGVLRPGIVHRLDKDTSGLMVAAKEDRAHKGLSEQIHDRKARRTYIALLEGNMPNDSGFVDKPIGRHPVNRKKMAIVSSGRRAVSHYAVLKRWAAYTLVQVSLETGRTHQIRVHMASLGYPVVGDIVYNCKQTGTLSKRHKLGLSGHALHATRLSFTHPVTGSLLEFDAPLPEDFQRLIDSL